MSVPTFEHAAPIAGTKHYYLNQAPRVFDMQDFNPSLMVGMPTIKSLRSRVASFHTVTSFHSVASLPRKFSRGEHLLLLCHADTA